jgi:hypothetical protein
MDTLTLKGGAIVEDTIYKRELSRVQSQLANAVAMKMKDSVMIYQYEVNYMLGQIVSLTKSIPKADTSNKFGIMIRCLYQIQKSNRTVRDSVPYVIDEKMNIRNHNFIDTMIARSYRKIK